MQRLSGVLMVLAGTALGGYLVLPAPRDGAENLAEVTRISAAPDRETRASGPASITTPALAAPAEAAAAQPGADSSKPNASGVRVFSPAQPLTNGTSTWTAVVTSEPTAQGKLSSPRPGDAETRAVLASDLQRELKRVGCYGGDITGTWTPSTKRAMSAFMERVNATLPVDEPDYILLTLVQGHAAAACGADCPTGQVLSGAGRCVPQAVVAQASRKSQREEERRASEQLKAQQQERLAIEQRASEAKRLADTRKSAEAARVAAAVVPPAPKPAVRIIRPQQTAAVEREVLPWLADDAPAAAPPLRTTTPPPGMMSIGGPRVIRPELPASAAAVTPDSGPRPAIIRNNSVSDVPAEGSAIIDRQNDSYASPQAERRPAVRPAPIRQAAIAGLPGTKSGPAGLPGTKAGITGLPGTKSGVAGLPGSKSVLAAKRVRVGPGGYVYRPARIVRRPSPAIAYAPPRPKYYASNSGGKVRRGQPRPGTAQFNIMQSLGGIY
ncbi:MAG: peptidoglycan-binding domain-containing protein [Hyphomicrobium sp.]